MDAEKLVEDLTGRVRDALAQADDRARKIIGEAEERARKLVADAEADAKRIRERAEAEADERLGKVREALSGLEGVLGGGVAETSAEVDPGPPPIPEPAPPRIPEPTPPVEPEPMPPREPEPLPPDPEIVPPAPPQPDRQPPESAANGAPKGDEIGARIVATKMALDGSSREAIARHLAENYEVEDAEKLLDFVMERAKR